MSGTAPSYIPGDCRGQNFFRIDDGLRQLLPHYLERAALAQFEPHFDRLGDLAGGRLDELAGIADKNPPLLHARDRMGRDEDWIEYHPAYREMEQIAFADFQFQAMSHRGGVLGSAGPLPPVAKYVFQYLFVQGEFGLMCPISVTDTSIHLIRKYADSATKEYLLSRMLATDPARLWKGTQFMTEKAGGSDVGAIETVARQDNGAWRLEGEKWFCSHADADVALLLARPEGTPGGTAGLALFAMPRRRADGRRNAYRIVRLKDKLGTRSMASGEIRLDGAEAYLLGKREAGFKQMLDQVNLSRLSHGVRAAAMMRRCLNEALAAARGRSAFGRAVVEYPLMRRQLMKLLLPTEQALSMLLFTAEAMGAGREDLLRILTPLIKFRACRDNIAVATGAMEARGGNGYIEEWATARLVRDAHIGVLWEGTSNIIALDLVARAIGKVGAHRGLAQRLTERLGAASLPGVHRQRLGIALDRALLLAEDVARHPEAEADARSAATALYNAVTAVLLAWEGTRDPADARRALVSRLVLEHRLAPRDPLARVERPWEAPAADVLLAGKSVPMAEAAALLGD
ncbi:MAG: acyl-CoA dehydrogenase family protein [Stellaceae bacterium]